MGTPSIINIKVATRTGIRILEAHEIDMESESEEEELSKIEEDGPDSSFETCTSMASSATATTKFVFSHSSPTVPGSPSEAQRYAAATRRHMVSMLAEAQAAKEAEEKMEMERKDKELQEAKQVELKDSFRGSLLRKFQLIADEKKKATKEREAAVVVGQLKASGFL
jgi:hypothetical protein